MSDLPMTANPAPVQHALDGLSNSPYLWNSLRWLVEAGYHGEKAVIAHELAPFADVGKRRFLDFGCGTGAFAACFPAQHYVGIDPAMVYIQFAGRTRPGSYLASVGEQLPFAPASFDAALVLGVLHHLSDDVARAALAELHRVLRAGATLLVIEDVPPPDRWNVAGHAMHWLDRGGHIRSDADYRTLFERGYTVVRSYPMRSGICDYGVYVLQRSYP